MISAGSDQPDSFDLWLHTRRPGLTALTAGPVHGFAWLYRRIPFVRRHGYLTVCMAERPA